MTYPAGAVGLSPLEIATGVVFGSERRRSLPRTRRSPRHALEDVVRPALLRPPCAVSFSGGRDSSLVLAVAAHVARSDGLPPPIPATIRFRSASRSGESEWQERVVEHLRLEEWTRIDVEDELDSVGPVAADVLRRHGLLWPPNAHFHVPLLRAASGGSLLTGVGGDEMLGRTRWARAAGLLRGRIRPEPRDVLRIGLAFAPTRVRHEVLRRRVELPFPWLRSEAARAATEALITDAASEPLGARRRLAWRLSLRYVRAGMVSLAVLAADDGVNVVHPLAEERFCAALARIVRRRGNAPRSELVRAVGGDLLPPDVASRTSKAAFWEVAWGSHSRAFAARWNGGGLDPELVDEDALQSAFAAERRDGRLLLPLQAAWLATEGAAKV